MCGAAHICGAERHEMHANAEHWHESQALLCYAELEHSVGHTPNLLIPAIKNPSL
ncbi:hypothetical protein KPSA1_01145 [Pseudomonas syringae pv. actinidiae]|uniref:Uncharacterized protein n=1 Tax=Pseudomonas syringae pv. actinidiae TaxID=103796 RepID=A0A2V0QBP5_PSESF|nr:hypothetical protein KPSA1_01145 [Pseudomonas syringae pv. actinidiae]